MAAVYEILLGGAMQQRIAGAVPAEQITDVHFRTLMADPVATIEQAYAALGVPFHESMQVDSGVSRVQTQGKVRHPSL